VIFLFPNFIQQSRLVPEKHQFFNLLGKLAGRAMYFACINFFFFNMSKATSGSTAPIFTISSPNGKQLREYSRSGPVFFRFLKGRCHGNQFCVAVDLFARIRSISGSAGPIFTIFAPYSRYWIADDQSDLLFLIS